MLALPASPSIWHAPDGTIPSGLAEQARAHPYGRSSQSLPTTPPLRVAFPAGRLPPMFTLGLPETWFISFYPTLKSRNGRTLMFAGGQVRFESRTCEISFRYIPALQR